MEWRNWSGLASARPRRSTPRADARTSWPPSRPPASRDDREDGRHRPLLHRHRGRRRTRCCCPASLPGIVAVDRDAMTVTALAGTPLHVLNDALDGSACRCTTWATSPSRRSPARSPPAPTAPAAGSRRSRRRSPASSWSPAPASCSGPRRREPRRPRRRPARPRRPRHPHRRHPRRRAAVHAARPTSARCVGRGPRLARRARGRPRPRRRVLVPPHRPDAGQDQRPARRSAGRAAPPLAGWLDDDLLANRLFGW